MDISKMMIKVTKKLDAQFLLNDRFITPEEIFAYDGLLPALTKRADQLCALCMGYDLGANYEEAQGTILGSKVLFDSTTPTILRVLFLTDVLYELIKCAPSKNSVSLDELMYD